MKSGNHVYTLNWDPSDAGQYPLKRDCPAESGTVGQSEYTLGA